MNDKTNVIVLNQVDYKDNDAIINTISADYGRLSFYVKGYKKISSKNVYATQLFDYSTCLFDRNENKEIQILKSATLIDEFSTIKSDYEKTIIASIVCEIINCLNENDIFDFVLKTFRLINDTPKPLLIYNLFIVEIMNRLGINAYVDGCALCDSDKNISTISLQDGGFICSDCNKQLHLPPIDIETLRKFRVINKASYDVIDKLDDYCSFEVTKLLMGIFINYSGMNLKSYKALENCYKS